MALFALVVLEHTLGDYDQEERMVEYAALREALCQLPERERDGGGARRKNCFDENARTWYDNILM